MINKRSRRYNFDGTYKSFMYISLMPNSELKTILRMYQRPILEMVVPTIG